MRITGSYGPEQQAVTTMTEEQKETAAEILANYDPENMTPEDFEALRTEFQEAGISPSRDLMTMMQEAGFKRPPRPEPPQEPQEDEGQAGGMQKGELWQLYQQYQTGEITEDEFLEQMKSSPVTGRLINFLS